MAEMILRATGSKLKIISEIHVTSTQAQYDTCLFEFDEAWDGYGLRTAVFYSNPNNIKAMLLDGDNRCFIPWDAFSHSRYLYIGVYGNNGSSYLPTQFVEVMYQPGANLDDHLYPPTPGIYEQLAGQQRQIIDTLATKASQADLDDIEAALATKADDHDLNALTNSVNGLVSTKADKSEVDSLAAQITGLASGSPKGVYATLSDLQTAKPTGDSGIYIVSADGKWYFWSGSAWTAGGTYQGTALADYSVTEPKLAQPIADRISEYIPDPTVPIVLPYFGGKTVKITSSLGPVFYNGTQNLADILNIVDGTYYIGATPGTDQVTVTITGNRIKIVGTLSAAKYCVLSDNTGAGYEKYSERNYTLPYSQNGLHFCLYNRLIAAIPASASLSLRGASGNVTSMNISSAANNTFINFTVPATYYAVYMYLVPGTYDAEFSLALGVGPYDTVYAGSAVAPNTEISSSKTVFESRGLVCATSIVTAIEAHKWDRLYELKELSTLSKFDGRILVRNPQFVPTPTAVNQVEIYVPSRAPSGEYIRYTIARNKIDTPTDNLDIWRIDAAYLCTVDSGYIKQGAILMMGGEWECAIKISGRDDFIGGWYHGDEVMYGNGVFYADGKSVTLDGSVERQLYCEELRLLTRSKLYDPADHVTIVAEHVKEYVFTSSGIELLQRIEWMRLLNLANSYMAMLPVPRRYPISTGTLYTNKAYNDRGIVYDVGADNHAAAITTLTPGIRKQTVYGASLRYDCDLLDMDPVLPGAGAFVSDDPAYNKMYFDFCGASHDVQPGDVWRTRVRYNIQYAGGLA